MKNFRTAGVAVLAAVVSVHALAAPVKVEETADGVQLQNRRLVVTIKKGADGPVLVTRAKDVEPASITLVVTDKLGRRDKLETVEVASREGGSAVVRFASQYAEAMLTLPMGQPFAKVSPGKNAGNVQCRAKTRYALLPDFFAHDVIYDPTRYKSASMPVPAENFLLQLLEGNTAVVMLVWEGAISKDEKQPAEGKKVEEGGEEPKVMLLAEGEGDARRYTAGQVEFCRDKPVFVGVTAGPAIWHEVNVRSLKGGTGNVIEWKRPFDAKWRADYVLEGYDKKETDAVLKWAADEGITAGKYGKGWEQFYEKANPYSRIGRSRYDDMYGVAGEDSGFWGMRIQSRDFTLFDKKRRPDRYRNKPGACYFDEDKTLLAPMAVFPVGCAVDGGKLKKAQEKRKKDGKEPMHPPHLYGRAIIYPIDRYKPVYKGDSRSTPGSAYTVVDLMRNTLGEGPCEYILDLDGLAQRDWLANGKEGVRIYGGKTRRLGICPLTSDINNVRGGAVKKNRTLSEEELNRITAMLDDRLMFAKTIWKRNEEYRQWGKDFVAFCERSAKKSPKVKEVADGIKTIAQSIEKEMEMVKGRFLIPSGEKDAKGRPKAMRTTGDKALAYWDKRTQQLKEMHKTADTVEKLKNVRTGEVPHSGFNSFGDEIDWMVARLRRMVREIRHRAGAVDTSDPDVARFCSKVRRQCQAVLRNKHARETWGGED
jgi:hypothetical protein